MTNGELELKLQEMDKFKQDLTVQNKAVAALKQACIVSIDKTWSDVQNKIVSVCNYKKKV